VRRGLGPAGRLARRTACLPALAGPLAGLPSCLRGAAEPPLARLSPARPAAAGPKRSCTPPNPTPRPLCCPQGQGEAGPSAAPRQGTPQEGGGQAVKNKEIEGRCGLRNIGCVGGNIGCGIAACARHCAVVGGRQRPVTLCFVGPLGALRLGLS
jgi:hypothetical protein